MFRTVRCGVVFAVGMPVILAFKPVIMMHGVGSGASEMATIARLLSDTHPGTVATSLPLYENSPAAWDHDLETQVSVTLHAGQHTQADIPFATRPR